MRSDKGLTEDLRESDSWKEDTLSGKSGTDVARYRMSERDRVPMSLSGKERNHLFLSQSAESFTDISSVSGADSIKDGRSFAIFDFDRDGWQDMLLANANGPAIQLFRNQLGDNSQNSDKNFVALRFVGGNKTGRPSVSFGNRDGVGAKYELRVGDQIMSGELECGAGLAAQNSLTKIVGLGDAKQIENITIKWPKGATSRIENVETGTLVTFFEDPTESKDKSGVDQEKYLKELDKPEFKIARRKRTLEGARFMPVEKHTAKLNLYVSMATWCPSCKKHLPELKQLRTLFDESTLSMTGVPVSNGDTPEKLQKYVEEFSPAYSLLDSMTSDQIFDFVRIAMTETRREVLPTSVIVNSDGDVLQIMAGIPSASDFLKLLDADPDSDVN